MDKIQEILTHWPQPKAQLYLKVIFIGLVINAVITFFQGISGFVFIRSSAFLTPFIFFIFLICLGCVQLFVSIKLKKQEKWAKKAIFSVIGVKILANFFQRMGVLNLFWLFFICGMIYLLQRKKIGWLFEANQNN